MKIHKTLDIVVLLLVTLVLAQPAEAGGCPTKMVTVGGRIRHLQDQAANITVTLRTSKGDYSTQSEVSEGPFSVSVRFHTQSFPYTPLFGHRCNNRPKSVVVIIRSGERVLLDQRLKVKDSFERDGPSGYYKLKRDLEIDASDHSSATQP